MSDSTRAERQRWARRRRREGRRAYTIYLADDIAEELVSEGIMAPEEVADRHVLAQKLGDLLESFLLE